MVNPRVARGRRSQAILAAYWGKRGWPRAQAVIGAENGRDVKGMDGLAPEVKATADNPILGGLRQASASANGDLPFVVWRPNGYGESDVGAWVMCFTVHDGTLLLRKAGYGE